MGLLRIPLIPFLVGCLLVGLGVRDLAAGWMPAMPSTCANVVMEDHVYLRECVVIDVLFEGDAARPTAHWVVLAPPGSDVGTALIEVHETSTESVVFAVSAALAGGGIEVVRNHPSSSLFEGMPEVGRIPYTGEWVGASDHLSSRAWFFVMFGVLIASIDAFRLGVWFLRRLRGF